MGAFAKGDKVRVVGHPVHVGKTGEVIDAYPKAKRYSGPESGSSEGVELEEYYYDVQLDAGGIVPSLERDQLEKL